MRRMFSVLLTVSLLLMVPTGFALAEEPVHLIWWLPSSGDAPVDWPEIEAKLNEISAQKIGVTCEYKYMSGEQINRAMQVGEYFDIAFTSDYYNSFDTNVASGMFMEVSELVQEYGQDMLPNIPESLWEGVRSGEGIYGIPHMKDYGYEVFWILDYAYFVDELGMDPEAMKEMTFDEIEPYLARYKETYPNGYPIKCDKAGLYCWYYCLVDWTSFDYYIGLDWAKQGTEEELVVKSALDIPAFVERLGKLHDWYEKGYINPDAAVIQSLPRSQKGVVQSGSGWYGAESTWANSMQRPCFIARYDGPTINTSSLRGAISAICSFSEHPVEAMKLINLMNSDMEFRTLARYGIEGVHYEEVEPGIIRRTETGVANLNYGGYVHGSYALCPVEASEFEEVKANPNQWTEIAERYENEGNYSAALGFSFDITPVIDQCLAMKTIWERYMGELQTGTLDPAEVLPQMRAELESVGLNEVIAECQRQLDAFVGA